MSYTGSKNGNGIPQWIINNTPYHERYFELFAGSGAYYYNKRPAKHSWLNDLSTAVIGFHVLHASDDTYITQLDAIEILSTFNFQPGDFLYLDPPYPFAARRSGRAYYEHEMTDAQHNLLLQAIKQIQAPVMIATMQNDLYDAELCNWRKERFKTAHRRGSYYEIIYMNYPQPEFLHQYNHLGNGFMDRQRMKRKRNRFADKIAALPVYEQHLFIQELIHKSPAAVKHFMAMAAADPDIQLFPTITAKANGIEHSQNRQS